MSKASSFNARTARAKRPCPLWVDAFQRDTQHLGADEVGAYLLILMAMWTREACDFPDDDVRLAKVARISVRLWRSRVGPIIRAFFQTENGSLISKRLRIEAAYVERQVSLQHIRKVGQKSDKPLKGNEQHLSTDVSADDPRGLPLLPNYPTVQVSTAAGCTREPDPAPRSQPPTPIPRSASAEYDRVLEAAKVDVSKDVSGKWYSASQRHWFDRWREILSTEDIISEIRAIMAGKTNPPGSLKFFDDAMRRLMGLKTQGPPEPIPPDPPQTNPKPNGAYHGRHNPPPGSMQRIVSAASSRRAFDKPS